MSRTPRLLIAVIALGLVLLAASLVRADVRLPAIIGDNMVLQRGPATPVFGWAEPGERVTVSLGAQRAEAVADAQGNWVVRLNLNDVAGPTEVSVSGRNQINLKNVLVGEVWLCSGQSNMEWTLSRAHNARQEVVAADYPQIRLFLVKKNSTDSPAKDVTGTWQVCSPRTAPGFSAVGYFYGRMLHKQLGVPVGLIGSYWGGTTAEAWTPRPALEADPDLKPTVDRYDRQVADHPRARKEYEAQIAEWQPKVHKTDPGNAGFDEGYADPAFDDTAWQSARLPGLWDWGSKPKFDGAVWYRRGVEVPAEWAGQDLMVSIGLVDDFDITYFNGVQVGATADPKITGPTLRQYRVPGRLVKPGRNLIAVRIFDRGAYGGIGGPSSNLFLGRAEQPDDQLDLTGEWKMLIELELPQGEPATPRPPVPPIGPNDRLGVATLYNGMIHPLQPYGIRGAIWYQGESNTTRAEQYYELLPAMIRAWRQAWGQGDFPFHLVQLANFRARKAEPGDSDWAELRDAQTQTARPPNNGLAVAIDIGEADDIHPRNKQEVGRRLALVALARTYGKHVVCSGPEFDTMQVEADKVRVKLRNADGLKTTDGRAPVGFAVAGEDRQWKWAEARLEENEIELRAPGVSNPVAVRYAWADNPEVNLVNAAGLPAVPFRTDDWPLSTAGQR